MALRLRFRHFLIAAAMTAIAGPVDAQVRVEAYVGQPYGVGKATFPVVRDPLSDDRFTVRSADGRVHYPVLSTAPVRQLLRRLLEIETPRSVTVYFLFRGDEPLTLEAYGPSQQTASVSPRVDPRSHRKLLDDWWSAYRLQWRDLRRNPEYPPVVHNFVAATLARRLGRDLPPPERSLLAWGDPQLTVWDSLFTGENYQLEMDRRLLLDEAADDTELGPLPAPIPWAPLEIDVESLGEVEIEPMARQVPEECFYIRYGRFTNYLWFRDLTEKWQGDLQNMLQRRGIDDAASQRIEDQLSLRQSAMAKVLGPQVIADVALIGLDPYTSVGSAVGIVFEAKNSFLLNRDLTGQRREALERYPDAVEETLTIREQSVSLISSPSGAVRSYYVQQGDFHLVATSRRLVERFLAAGAGESSLAKNAGFLLARSRLSVARNDAIFAHIPSQFFQQLASPAVWIENHRRLTSLREMKLLGLARLAARAEGIEATSIDELKEANFLPRGFSNRVDESQLTEDEQGLGDSIRGRRGLFVPIGDQAVTSATRKEADAYRRFADRFLQQVGRMPPITVAAQRIPRGQQGESLDLELLVEPIAGLKLGKVADVLGPPSHEQILPTEGDLAHFELVLATQFALLNQDQELHHLFGAVRDFTSALVVDRENVESARASAELIRGYLGAWPRPGLLALFTGSNPLVSSEPEALENEMFLAGSDDLFLLSFKRDVVADVLPQLVRAEAERPAQARMTIRDLTGTELSKLVAAIGYKRARETSIAASRLMNSLTNQLHVPRPDCREMAERLIDGRLVCPLGGEYVLVEPPAGLPVWISSALSAENQFLFSSVPDDYQLPLLGWFRGAEGELLLGDEALAARLKIDMDQSAVPWTLTLPQP